MKLRTADSFNALGCVHRRPLMGNSAVRGKKRRRGVAAAGRGTHDSPQGTQGTTEEQSFIPSRAKRRCTLHRRCRVVVRHWDVQLEPHPRHCRNSLWCPGYTAFTCAFWALIAAENTPASAWWRCPVPGNLAASHAER